MIHCNKTPKNTNTMKRNINRVYPHLHRIKRCHGWVPGKVNSMSMIMHAFKALRYKHFGLGVHCCV